MQYKEFFHRGFQIVYILKKGLVIIVYSVDMWISRFIHISFIKNVDLFIKMWIYLVYNFRT